MTNLRQAAQQALEAYEQHEPLAVVMQDLRTALEQQAEPVETYIHAYRSQPHPNDFGIPKGHWWKAKQYADALYTTPPQRQWVGLTDDDCTRMSAGDKLVAMWAESKLKERNNG